MLNKAWITASLLLAAASATAADARSPGQSASAAARPATAIAAVQSVLDSYVRSGTVPGAVAAIGRGDAPPTFVAAGRIADDAAAPKAGPDSLWRVYSMTKPITAMAAMILIEQGKMKLDEPVSDFIPAFKSMRVVDSPAALAPTHPAPRPITIRNLLTHTSGLTYQIIGTGPLPTEYKRLGLLGGRVDAEASKVQPQSLAAFADRLATVPLLADPGTEWHYSVSLDVLGRVIEVASGVPFDRFVESRILKPLGMNSTYWTVPQSQAGRLATSYLGTSAQRTVVETGAASLWLRPPLAPYGGSGLVSSARDYDRFLQMLSGDGKVGNVRILKRATAELAMSNLLPAGVRVVENVTTAKTPATGFGAGGSLYLTDAPNGVHAGTYGWFGAAGTIAFIDPKQHLRVTVMVNYFPPKAWPLYEDVVRALYGASP
ncbi:serine hydrolase domain-containing protein [Sphingomonas mali]|uniref:serine hydrolase domain-containing protein n=1 Tax=Sphingomonas mali TaxID=40682 RepID=UPI00082AB343|nr:serine hydrolase domain-containing protein [Sphingomonas mali]